jgi:hypothetical protein
VIALWSEVFYTFVGAWSAGIAIAVAVAALELRRVRRLLAAAEASRRVAAARRAQEDR